MENKVIQGDCLEVMKGMPDKSVDLVLTDPPYGMNYQSAWRTATPQYAKIDGDKVRYHEPAVILELWIVA